MIKVIKAVEKVYANYHGDTTIAIVVDGVCVRSWVDGQTGSVYTRNNPDDPFKGVSEDALKQSGFTYRHTDTVYTCPSVPDVMGIVLLDTGEYEFTFIDGQSTTYLAHEVEVN